MSTIKETFRVTLTSAMGPIKKMELTIQTYGKGAPEAMAQTQALLNNEGGPVTSGLEISEMERIID